MNIKITTTPKKTLSNLELNFYFSVLFTIPLIALFLKKISPSFSIADSVDEISIILALPLVAKGLIKLAAFRRGRYLLAAFFLYILSGIISGVIKHVPLPQLSLQAALETKILIFVSIFFAFSRNSLIILTKKYTKFIKVVISLSIPLIAWQFAMPENYHSFFPAAADKATFNFFDSIQLQRASGLFWFSGQLAIFAGISSCVLFFYYINNKTSKNLAWFVTALIVLISTFSRLEILGTLAAILLIHYSSIKKNSKILVGIILVLIAPLIYSTLQPLIAHAASEYQLSNIKESEAARVVFYYYSTIAAIDNFPLGTGFGTFGGKSAVIYNSSAYSDYNFDVYWWYREGIYLTDTFWPHILGETGIIGLFAISFFMYNAWKLIPTASTFRNTLRYSEAPPGDYKTLYITSLYAASCFILLLLNSMAAPNYYEIISFLPCMLFVTLSKMNGYTKER